MDPSPEAYVVDASVAVKWFLKDEVLSEQALEVWRRQNDGPAVLAAPAHIHVEASNAIVSASRYNPPRISFDDGRTLIRRLLRTRFQIVPTSELIFPAFELTTQHQVSIYDALYLAMSVQYDIPLVTADARFYREVGDRPEVLWLGDIEPH